MLEHFLLFVQLGLCFDLLTSGGVLGCGFVCGCFHSFLVAGYQEGFPLVCLGCLHLDPLRLLGQLVSCNFGLLCVDHFGVVLLEPLGYSRIAGGASPLFCQQVWQGTRGDGPPFPRFCQMRHRLVQLGLQSRDPELKVALLVDV